MPNDLSIIHLIVQASVPVQIVLALLAFASVTSWAIIFQKRMLIRRAQHEAEQFENSFWSGGDLAQLYRGIEARGGATGMASIFEFGFREFARLRQQGSVPPDQLLDGARRAMRVAQLKEVDRLEYSLATVGSTSPYVGLFGTVWGIMSAFASLGNVQQATLSMVAPGISEALIATAIGLFAAIPAVVAFNRFADQVGRLEVRYDGFMEEFSSILQRHAARGPDRATPAATGGGHGAPSGPLGGVAPALPSIGLSAQPAASGAASGATIGGAR
jgi:biopolymer transport protein TolQ